MLKRHWIAATTAGLALLIAFSVGGYILGWGLGVDAGEYQANTDTYTKHAADEIESACTSGDALADTECIVRVIEATNEHKRAERDLIAQRNMARWALLMLIATVAMAVITGGGVYYVWRTLKVTREIGEAQVRAYLSVKDARVTPNVDGPRVMWNFKVSLKNAGQSPARKIEAIASLRGNHVGVTRVIPDIESGGTDEVSLRVSQAPNDIQWAYNSDTKVFLHVSVCVRFQDVFAGERGITEEIYDFFGVFDLVGGVEVTLSPAGRTEN